VISQNNYGKYFFLILTSVTLVLTWLLHPGEGISPESDIWADRAGYYIYLPATFIYHFETRKIPADLDIKTGAGFSIDTNRNKIETKYTYGVALMEMPFFLSAKLVSHTFGMNDEYGFSNVYSRMLNLAAVLYLILGLWLLKKFLDHYFSQQITLFVILLIFIGTNLFYYSIIEGTMSHVFSFCLFSLYLLSLKKFFKTGLYRYFIWLSAAFSLAVLIRPTNALLLIFFFFWDVTGRVQIANRFKQFLRPTFIIPFIVILFVTFLPQMIYWKYLSGNWLHFSYRNEGFLNWQNPMILEVLFSPVNGLFLYTPLAIFFLAGIIIMIVRKKINGWLISATFIVLTYICASWKMWYFGCSFGQRSFVEYYTILAVPFGFFITSIFRIDKFYVRSLVFFFIFLFVSFNLVFFLRVWKYDTCYFGSTWDWDHYRHNLERAGYLSPCSNISSFENDFENLAIFPASIPSTVFVRSGIYCVATKGSGTNIPLFSVSLDNLGYSMPKEIEFEVWMLKPGKRPTGAFLNYALYNTDKVIYSEEEKLDPQFNKSGEWVIIKKRFIIPDMCDRSTQMKFSIENPGRSLFYLDDLSIRYCYSWN